MIRKKKTCKKNVQKEESVEYLRVVLFLLVVYGF